MYADVVFPLKLPPLTYKVPEDAPHDLKGRIIKAPLMGKSHYGLVVSVTNESRLEKKKNIKEIQGIHHHFASESTLSFLRWLSDYYLSPMGVALKSSFFEEAVKTAVSPVRKKLSNEVRVKNNEQKMEAENSELSLVYDCIKNKNYKSFLYHAPSISHEYSLFNKVLNKSHSDMHGAIILVPEIGQIERLAQMLKNIFGERVCVIHSNLTKKKRIDSIARIIAGQSDVILGTRSAILAPLRDVSLIAVLNEHSPSYKGEEGLRYNARNVAVMRGFMEKSCVLLSSVCPSVESIYNAKTGKYNSITPSLHRSIEKHPKIKISDMKKEKTATISRDILKEAKVTTSENGRFLFLVNRKGYSLIRCEDCGNIVQCKKCNVPLVFYKGKNTVRCHYCGHEEIVPENCEECKGFNIKPFGAGTERIKEELGEALKTEAILVEKGPGSWGMGQDPDITSFVIGTPYAIKKLMDEKFDAVALFNIDGLLAQPDFRAYERAFQEVMQISQMVKTEGSLYVQTYAPKNKILRFIKNYDFQGFYGNELSQRKTLDYPPFSRIILFNIFMKRDVEKFLHDIQKIIYDANTNGLELLGPVEIPSSMKSYKHCIQILLKSKDRRLMHNEAGNLLKKLEKLKGIKINVDVDPLKI
ncbi:replication restart helicase PriA [Dissulfurispira sp.]|uniref:replication restart helicase PriA n=1 Tax=Dissulfurispira sp. TaxID=2817609 RepID=UPI002FD9676A